MKKILLSCAVLSILGIVSFSTVQPVSNDGDNRKKDDTLAFVVPEGWPDPVYDFVKYPMSMNGIALGRKLFYETLLSSDSSFSCSSCHLTPHQKEIL